MGRVPSFLSFSSELDSRYTGSMKPLLMAVLLGLAVPGFAEEADEAVVQVTPPRATHVAQAVQALVQVSIITPQTFTLTNSQYETPYARNFAGMPSIQGGLAMPLFLAGGVEAQAVGSLGYGFKEGIFNLTTVDGAPMRDLIRLHRLPASLGVKFLYHIPWLTFVKPSLTVGGGAQLIFQAGRLPGFNDNFWLPYYYFSPALTFFENRVSTDWFGGFTFGISYQNDLSPKQVLRAWSFDLSVNLFL